MWVQRFRRRWRWLITLVLLLFVGMIGFVIVHTPSRPTGHLIIERQESASSLFDTFDFLTQRLQTVTYNNSDGIGIAQEMNLSSDDKRLAFVGAKGNIGRIYVADAPFATIRLISSGPSDFTPQLSPDGSKLIFVGDINYFTAVFIVDLNDGVEHQLTQYTNDLEPDWSPDGKRIVFTTSRDGFQELYTMAPDGSDLKRLTNNVNQNDLRAKYSPDGKWIAYMTNYSVGDGTGEIGLMNADGQNQQRLTSNKQDDREPRWSPDSRYISYIRSDLDHKGSDIYVYDVSNSQTHQLTSTSGFEYQPVWSPDSNWIVFISNPSGDGHDLYFEIMRADGTERHRLMAGSDNVAVSYYSIWVQEP